MAFSSCYVAKPTPADDSPCGCPKGNLGGNELTRQRQTLEAMPAPYCLDHGELLSHSFYVPTSTMDEQLPESNLFAVNLGGRAAKCNIELHDVAFAVGPSIEATYEQLMDQWFGDPWRL